MEAAIYLGRSKCRLRQLVWDGRIPVVQDSEGGNWYFDRQDLDAFIEANKHKLP